MAIQHNIFLLDRLGRVSTLFSNDIPSACPYFGDEHIETIDNGYESYEFSVPVNHASGSPDLLEEEKQFIIKDLDSILHLFTIRKLTQTDDEITVFGETSALDLMGEVVRPVSYTGQYVTVPLEASLIGTGWEVGIVEVNGQRSITFDYTNPIKALDDMCKEWGGEPRFRVQMDGNRLSRKFIDILSRRGANTGKTFEYRKDIKSITREVVSQDIATAFVGISRNGEDTGSEEPLTLASVEWKKSLGHPVDKPMGQDWIGIPPDDPSFQNYARNGRHITKLYESDAKSLTELIENTWLVLNRRKNPTITYDLDVLLLERYSGYEHEKVRAGDSVWVKDFSYKTPIILDARVQETKRSYSDNTKDSCVVGDYQPVVSPLLEKVRKLEKIINDNRHKWYTP